MKQIIRVIITYVITAATLIILLFSVALIPRRLIETNIKESAEYLTRNPEHFVWVIPGVEGSRLDHYADSMLLNVTYYLDEQDPLQSLMWSRYYWEEGEHINKSLLKGVVEHIEPNREYLRYWHGSQIFVRPLLLFWSVHQIYIFHAFVLLFLLLWLIRILVKAGMNLEAASLCISMVAVNIWFVPFCLEYFWMFELMLIISVIVTKVELKGNRQTPDTLFLAVGMLTAFLDFFTTETLTLLIPLLLIFRIRSRKEQEKGAFFIFFSCSYLWGLGYVTMWGLKWLMASFVLGQNVMPYVSGSISEHLGQFDQIPVMQQLVETIIRNVGTMFPFGYRIFGAIVSVVLVIIFFVIPVLQRRIVLKRTIQRKRVGMYFLIGAIPYLRYIVIRHHSWFHFFFMHRAQATSIMAMCLILPEVFEICNKRTGDIHE